MNALVPAFVAVLLAEIGGPLILLGRQNRTAAAFAMVVMIMFAVAAGWTIAAVLDGNARTLLLGLALLFAGSGRSAQPKSRAEMPTVMAGALILYRSPAPFLAFGFAACLNAPFSAAVGAMAGVAMSVLIGSIQPTIPRAFRVGAGVMLLLAGIFAGLNGLRLV